MAKPNITGVGKYILPQCERERGLGGIFEEQSSDLSQFGVSFLKSMV